MISCIFLLINNLWNQAWLPRATLLSLIECLGYFGLSHIFHMYLCKVGLWQWWSYFLAQRRWELLVPAYGRWGSMQGRVGCLLSGQVLAQAPGVGASRNSVLQEPQVTLSDEGGIWHLTWKSSVWFSGTQHLCFLPWLGWAMNSRPQNFLGKPEWVCHGAWPLRPREDSGWPCRTMAPPPTFLLALEATSLHIRHTLKHLSVVWFILF